MPKSLPLEMSKEEAFNYAINRYVKGGGNEAEGRKLLEKEIAAFTPRSLTTSLIYWGFATAATADRIAAALAGAPK